MLTGVYFARKKSGQPYYRASITYLGKHISLGSFSNELKAHRAYKLAGKVLYNPGIYNIDNYPSSCLLSFQKWVVLINVRDNKIYIKNPIYIKKHYFLYYIEETMILKFDVEDLFHYARHKILMRGGHLFTSEYGMQINLKSRYGIKNYAISEKDFRFINGDDTDYRYSNIEIINQYYGVTKSLENGMPIYLAKIHINGDYIIGRYSTEVEAAIAYNKAANILKNKGLKKNYQENYIDDIDEINYATIYQRIRISKKLRDLIV